MVVVDALDGFVRLLVTDTGMGISAGFLPHVFEQFSQSDSSITRRYGGLGLGLALVRHLVELQGGTVNAQSDGVGHGATFTVTLPVARSTDKTNAALTVTAARDQSPPRNQEPQARYAALKGLRVLFIDDDVSTREAMLEVLQYTGANIALAGSASDGFMALDTFKPQIIVCDIAMPGEDGYSFIRKLRAREANGNVTIPTLALTALASTEDKRRALASGFQLHLSKPIDVEGLRNAVLQLAGLTVRPSA
jgi:CheY-like chemotaxis protein